MPNDMQLIKLINVIAGEQCRMTDTEIEALEFDSRRVGPGTLFVAMKGEKFDGHDFIEAAIKNLRAQVIDIDYKIIESCSSIFAYHPREQLSAGVMCEMVYSMSLAKFVYAYYPFEPSPFFEWYTTKIFSDEKKMVKYLTDIAK